MKFIVATELDERCRSPPEISNSGLSSFRSWAHIEDVVRLLQMIQRIGAVLAAACYKLHRLSQYDDRVAYIIAGHSS